MTPKLKTLWLTALRSGEFKQARQTLKNSAGGMCCLGVLAHVCIENGMVPRGVSVCEQSDSISIGRGPNGGSLGCLGPANTLAHKFGLKMLQADTLAVMNDKGKDFLAIADWIEENVK